MKILFFTNVISPYRNDFFNLLSERGIDLSVFTYGYAQEITAWSECKLFSKYNHIFVPRNVIISILFIFKVITRLNKNDKLVIGGYGLWQEMLLIFLAKLFKKYIYINIDGYLTDKVFFRRIIKIYLINLCSEVLVSGLITKKLLFQDGVKIKMHVYFFSSTSYIEFNSSEFNKRFDLLFVGSISKRKGIYEFLKNFISLDLDLSFCVIGSGPLLNSVIKLVEGKSNIHIMGNQTREIVFKYMQSSKALIVPSERDIWGLVINEAIVNNLAVLASKNVQSGYDLIEDGINGFLYSNLSNPLELKRLIFNCLELDFNSKLVLNRIKSNKYSIENMVERHLFVFNLRNE